MQTLYREYSLWEDFAIPGTPYTLEIMQANNSEPLNLQVSYQYRPNGPWSSPSAPVLVTPTFDPLETPPLTEPSFSGESGTWWFNWGNDFGPLVVACEGYVWPESGEPQTPHTIATPIHSANQDTGIAIDPGTWWGYMRWKYHASHAWSDWYELSFEFGE